MHLFGRLISWRLFKQESEMAYVITKPCIGVKDAACVSICPVDCIHPTKEEAAFQKVEQLYIDPDVCIHCGQCVAECPANAIYADEDVPQEWKEFVEINAAYFRQGENLSAAPLLSQFHQHLRHAFAKPAGGEQ
jgi:NAD-dependent dihydropyrimidine dehydrogenase PreA subunit